MVFRISALPLATACLALAVAFQPVKAQNYPGNRPVTIIVPFTAGGPTDKVTRDLADAMRKHLNNVSIVIDNAPGAGATIGIGKAARARADGHTLLLTHVAMATAPSLYRKLPFDVQRDFEFVGAINDVPMVLIARPTLQAGNYAELMEWVQAQDGGAGVNLGNAGLGSASHLCGLVLQQAIGADMVTVPYAGTAPAISDLIGGQIDLMCDQTTNTTPHVAGQKVKTYAVSTQQRLDIPPYTEVPTLDESGLPGFNVTIWHGLYAPKGTPQPVLERLNTALKAALQDPEFIWRQTALGAVVVTDERMNPEEHRQFVAQETSRWSEVIRAAGEHAN